MMAFSWTLALGVLLKAVTAHTWIEQMQVIGGNGSFAGDFGYPRGYVARTDPAFTGFSNKWQLPSPDGYGDEETGRTRITEHMSLCHPSQRTSNYTDRYPPLSAPPGAYVAAKYLENGHVTILTLAGKPNGNPKNSGTVYIFGTYAPSETETLFNVLSWTKDGKGGDQKGFLIASQNYDDGRCHQLNQAPLSINRQMSDGNHPPGQPTVQLEQWCESDFLVPADAPVGSTLSIYYVWDWPTSPQTEGSMCGKSEFYISCGDVKIVGDSLDELAAKPKIHSLDQQDPQTNAVSDYLSRTAFSATPTIITDQECSFTSATTSQLPASLTQPTSLRAGFSTSILRPPMPTYRIGAVPSGSAQRGSGGGPQGSVQDAKPALPKHSSSSGTTSSIAEPSPTNQVDIVFRTFTITETAVPSSSTPVQAPPGRLRRHIRS